MNISGVVCWGCQFVEKGESIMFQNVVENDAEYVGSRGVVCEMVVVVRDEVTHMREMPSSMGMLVQRDTITIVTIVICVV